MARGKRDGIVIAGGGLAACFAALAMARLRPETPLLIVEEAATFGGGAYRHFPEAELGEDGRALIAPTERWPGFYVAFPGLSRKLKLDWAGFPAAELHRTMVETLTPRQYRLGARVVAVREDALVLDGGEEIRAEGAIDARGLSNLSALELLYRASLEREYRFKAPHGVDRPVLVDATIDQAGGLRFMQCVPLAPDRMVVVDTCVSERAQPDGQADARLARYVAARGWGKGRILSEHDRVTPLPTGGDFAAFWRHGGARVAKLGLRGGFVNPATGRTIGDAVATAMLLATQNDLSGAALHDVFEAEAKALWRRRETQRAIPAALARAKPEDRRDILQRLYALEPGRIARIHGDAMGLLDRLAVQRTLRGN